MGSGEGEYRQVIASSLYFSSITQADLGPVDQTQTSTLYGKEIITVMRITQ